MFGLPRRTLRQDVALAARVRLNAEPETVGQRMARIAARAWLAGRGITEPRPVYRTREGLGRDLRAMQPPGAVPDR